jgi:DNA-directed RNA polymerase specialized sigma subunit
MNEAVRSFKCDLENYPLIKRQLDERKQELTEIIYKMQGVRAVQISSEGKGNGTPVNKVILYGERKDFIEKEIVRLVDRLSYVDEVLEYMRDMERNVLDMHYRQGKSYQEIADDLGYSMSWLKKKVDREIAVCIRTYERVSDSIDTEI